MERTKPCDDLDHQIGIGLAFGLTVERISEICGASESTVKRHKACLPTIRTEALVKTYRAQSDQRIAERIAATAFEDAKTRISRILAKALGASESVIDKAIDSGDFAQLVMAHKVGEWAAKFEVSEAPRHLKIDNEHTHTISPDSMNLLEQRLSIVSAQLTRLLPPAMDVEFESVPGH